MTCVLCSRAGLDAATCRLYRIVKCDTKENGRRGNGNGNGNGGVMVASAAASGHGFG